MEEKISRADTQNHRAYFERAPETEHTADDPGRALKVRILKNDRAFDEIEDEWNTLLEKADTHIFQTYEWQRTWWKFFEGDNELHIITFRNNGYLVGIAPFYIEKLRLLGLYTYNNLRFLACCVPEDGTPGIFSDYSPSDYLDIIADPEYRSEIGVALAGYLEEHKELLDRIELDELPEAGIIMTCVVPVIEEKDWQFKKTKREICPRIALPDSVEEYLDSLDKKTRYSLRYSGRTVTEKQLFRAHDVKGEEEFESVFDQFVDLHQQRWNKQGYPGIFADDRFKRFLKDISAMLWRRNRLKMKVAFDNEGNCLAVDLAYVFNNRVYDYQKAFDDTSDLAKYSPGMTLTYFLIEDAINEEKEVFDLMRGGEKYKLRLTTSSPKNWRIVICPSRKQGLKLRLYQLTNIITGFRHRLSKELLLLRIHIWEWGVSGFIPKYIIFIKNRYQTS